MAKKKRQTFNLDELNAYKKAFGSPLLKKEIFVNIAAPAIVSGGYVFILTYYWWLAVLFAILGGFYGYRVSMPLNIKRVYEQQALYERNRFVNYMTQILSDPNKTVVTALGIVADRAKGEFRDNLKVLRGTLMDATPNEITEAFHGLKEKYPNDIVFDLYLEQLVTATIEGHGSMDTLKNIKSWHNSLIDKQKMFIARKKVFAREFRMTVLIGVGVVGVLTICLGFPKFIDYFAHFWIGWVTSAIYLGAHFHYYRRFQQQFVDDDVMEVAM
ncbi:hypothetical protein JR536_002931 [Listeria monocytogenes]|uniref:hypothetical protein n=1 Tax=Listeria monocytogenes TaxID=1639 RepID=UPI00098E325B|nr:hypothetical protein [Listeria monocytogenes]EAC2557518.1 hypothetical protein [Listeria monocytogenes]EAC4520844.1 hypothetical protein [Listeria monocytogenes]EAE3700726.1 hypothetical protein [Listeria monocytogenes]EAE8113421.1 hypothetical protein [Listeria monocytogenes]EAE8116653.1 hypothetical protein [Listeria monocytogenes]